MALLQLVLLVALGALLVTAAVTDIRSRIIGNGLNLTIALLAVPWWIASGWGMSAILLQVAVALAVLLLFGCCFALGMMGGGDVKLLTALALWLPLPTLAGMLFWMVLGGGLLTAGMLVAHKLRNAPDRPEIPYGVAIVGAALLVVANDILTTLAA
jgi:prepilin peptidase CpaA